MRTDKVCLFWELDALRGTRMADPAVVLLATLQRGQADGDAG